MLVAEDQHVVNVAVDEDTDPYGSMLLSDTCWKLRKPMKAVAPIRPWTWRVRTPPMAPPWASATGLIWAAEGVCDALVDGVGLAVDAVGVDLQQDGDTVPGAAGNLGRRDMGVQPVGAENPVTAVDVVSSAAPGKVRFGIWLREGCTFRHFRLS